MNNNNMDFLPRHKLNKIMDSVDHKSFMVPNGHIGNFLAEQIKDLNLDTIDFENSSYDQLKTKIEKQKVYFWIRVYLSEEIEIEPGSDISIKYVNSGEKLDTKFICYAKMGGGTINYENGEPVVANYNSEDNRKVLCLMVDEEKINYDSEDIPFIKKLFKIGRHYEYQLMKRTDLILTVKSTDEMLNYFDIEF